jgi:hypothetical protein
MSHNANLGVAATRDARPKNSTVACAAKNFGEDFKKF